MVPSESSRVGRSVIVKSSEAVSNCGGIEGGVWPRMGVAGSTGVKQSILKSAGAGTSGNPKVWRPSSNGNHKLSVGVCVPELKRLGTSFSSASGMMLVSGSGSVRLSLFLRRRAEGRELVVVVELLFAVAEFSVVVPGRSPSEPACLSFVALELALRRDVLFLVPRGRPKTLETL